MRPASLPSRYAVRELLGTGGSGRVYRVRDSIRELDLALKLVTCGESAFLREEFDILRQIRHEGLVRVFDCGTLGSGGTFYTMELVVGGDWGQRSGSPQPADEVRRIITSILRGLAHLHCHGVIHSDLKPGNVLLGRDGSIKITDIGMGGIKSECISPSGTPGYMAPELWEGARADVRSDIYAVGVMSYEALTGRHPFLGKTVGEVVSGQLAGWVASPSAHGVVVPADLERAIMRSLERDPNLRQGSADEYMQGMGIDEQVGEILDGKFVARADDLTVLGDLIARSAPESQSLVYVSGPPGIGKTAVIEELAQLVLVSGGKVSRWSPITKSALWPLCELQSSVPLVETHGDEVGQFMRAAENLLESSYAGSHLLICDVASGSERTSIDTVRALAAPIHALSVERQSPSRTLLVCELHGEPPALERFERVLSIAPLAKEEIASFVNGYLGAAELEREVLEWLHSTTGGVPEQLSILLADLIERRLLRRSGGKWYFREKENLRGLEPTAVAASRWRSAWFRLSEERRQILALLVLFRNGLTSDTLRTVLPESSQLLLDLSGRGWVRLSNHKWHLASESVRRLVLSLASRTLTCEAERRILTLPDGSLDREDRAVLLLRNGPSGTALEEGLWAGEQSMLKGDYSTAEERAQSCLALARSRGDRSGTERALMVIANVLHRRGEDDLAAKYLEDEWAQSESEQETEQEMNRQLLLGLIGRSRGQLEAARSHLSAAIALADHRLDHSAFLRSHAELAEIDWRHGDENARSKAIARIRSVLSRQYEGKSVADEQAGLTYQLGSALILGGNRHEARSILEGGLTLEPGDYWRMRIAIALATASYYLGDFTSALRWMDEAWHRAEAGGFDSFKARILSNRAGICYGLGNFREALDQHNLSARWSRRTGNLFEYLAASSGASINLTMLGVYEEAIAEAREAQVVARQLNNNYEVAKNLELEALAFYNIGDNEEAGRLARIAAQTIEEHGFADVRPRLYWLLARLATREGNADAAERLLVSAEEILLKTRDWEDLPCVQIELQWVISKRSGSVVPLEAVRRITVESELGGALVVYLRGALAIASMLVASEIVSDDCRNIVVQALGRAERAGALEFGWQLSHLLGVLSSRAGDRHGATVRYSHALRGLREIAGKLTPRHRELYLETPQASCLLRSIGDKK